MIQRKDLPSIIGITEEQIASINANLEIAKRRSTIYKASLQTRYCPSCSLEQTSRILPFGNPCSSIMFITGESSSEDFSIGTPFSDKEGAIFHVLMEKLNIPEDQIYVTSLFKCVHDKEDIGNALASVVSSLCIEILTIRPKIIVGIGNQVKEILLNYLDYPAHQYSLEEMRGKMHPIAFEDHSFHYIQTYDLSRVIKDFNNLSGNFANDIIGASKAAGIIK